MFRNVHCALLFAHLLHAVVMDGAEENNLCALVHRAYELPHCQVTYYMAVATAPGIMQLL